MIQLNLLPDVKLNYLKAQRSRKVITGVAIVVSAAAVGLLVLMLVINGLQRKHLTDLSKDIDASSSKLQKQPDISRILTVQNQLSSLTGLHDAKPASSRLLGYLNQVTPAQVSITTLDTTNIDHTMTISGTADTLSSVNKYIDTLKSTTYKLPESEQTQNAFSSVVLGSFGLATGGSTTGKAASYTIMFGFEPVIFDTTKQVTLIVPKQTTTRQNTQSTDLFGGSNTTPGRGN
jgi:Tfp pilus assembly protein PilN